MWRIVGSVILILFIIGGFYLTADALREYSLATLYPNETGIQAMSWMNPIEPRLGVIVVVIGLFLLICIWARQVWRALRESGSNDPPRA